ncbi:DUF4381 domain-containing protein [Pseudoalteromonas fenneropenaei]|uniref:DUF4381 domain-containing protein n=1 Tax=Pseudoalteromonas fenneropenaei TaxID=1737459 RepID=A0ABV7CMU8_9GAMM
MQSSPLDALHDVLPPEQVSWWPLSPIAWLIVVAVLLLLGLTAWWLIRRYRFTAAKREAIKASTQLDNALALHTLLKRLTKHYYGIHYASQSQAQWQKILNHLAKADFSHNELQQLYSPSGAECLNAKLKLAIKHFKPHDKRLKEVLDV